MIAPTYRTMCEAILGAAQREPGNGFTFQDDRGSETFLSFPALEAATAQRAAALRAAGMSKGDRLGMIVVDHQSFVLSFLGALRAGIIPVPLYPPMYLGSLDLYMQHTASILTSAGASVLCCSDSLKNVLWSLVDMVPTLRSVVAAESLTGDAATGALPVVTPDDTAFLQYTSGSTGQPKGVVVTHGCLIANVHEFTTAGLKMNPRCDVGVSWLPLFHDMGLIGFVLGSIYCGVSVVYIPTLRFVKNVAAWLDTVHRHRGTVSFAPNFAFSLVTRRTRDADLERWDLSCARNFGCAAEPIHLQTMRDFLARFGGPSRFPATALAPAYGLAEATLAVTMKPLGAPLRIEQVDHDRFVADGVAVAPAGDARVSEHISCGVPLPGFELAIVRGGNQLVGEATEGEIFVRGRSVCPRYHGETGTPVLVDDQGWLHTGDLGYLRDGELFVTGRSKDLIILNGRNIHPQTIEWATSSVPGVRQGSVVAFSQPGAESEQVIVVAEAKGDGDELSEAIASEVRRQVGVAPADVIIVRLGELPKTSSGKLQRQRVRELHRSGQLGRVNFRTQGGTGAQLRLAGQIAKSLWTRARTKVAPK